MRQGVVYVRMRLRTNDEELMCIAILHDVIEDSNGEYTIEKLREIGFSERVLAALSLLTHNPKEDYQEYVKKIAMNPDAILVKLEDLRDNSDITRMKGLREKDFERIKKYNKAFQYLQNVMDAMRKSGYL